MSRPTSTAFVAALRDRLGLPATADASKVYAATTAALENARLKNENSRLTSDLAELRAAQNRTDPDFQKKLADARMESVTASEGYQQIDVPGPSTGAKALQDLTSTPAYRNWR